ncbi:MAG TPA: serine hydrolase [Panacibacter sp.]|nr:serine hydrolase [Panacibacter sp.]HNP46827.1 serine hydrolase [Panacibacter sp.]
MTCRRLSFFVLVLLYAFPFDSHAQSLKRSTPGKEGVAAAGILQFIDAAEHSKNELHSFILMRHGNIVAEGWWNPYAPGLKHTMYSCSKSFTATAIGFAVQEKLVKLDDKVVSFFPGDLPAAVSDNLAKLTVKDVLIMSDGQDPDPSFTVASRDTNWVRGFFNTPIINEPGTKFLYNSLGTYMLSAIVQKVTGQTTLSYLRPRLFEPLGISGIDWEEDTRGINTGGWGLRLKTEDMAKFAQLFLQKGKWQGKQVLPAGWAEEASSMKIMQDPNAPQSKKDSSDWLQGYCYQMWRCRNNAFRGDGAFGQYMIVMPDKDAVMAITCETADMQNEINLVWQYILPALKDSGVPKDKANEKQLKKKLKSLALPTPANNSSPIEAAIDTKTFVAAANDKQIRGLAFDFDKGVCHFTLKTDTATFNIDFTAGSWADGTTNKPAPSLTAAAKEQTAFLYPAKIAGAYTWKDDHTLELTLRYIESPHSQIITCSFNGNDVTVDMSNSLDFGSKKTTIKATGN